MNDDAADDGRGRTAFGGGDQTYLRDVQYRDGTRLDARSALHQRFSTSPAQFPDFVAGLVEWRPDLDVLECGAGTGRFWGNERTPRSVALTLTDLSPGMVTAAVAAAGAAGFGAVAGRECDVQRLPFADGSYDVVIANHMLYHVPDPDRAVAELARVLRPGGTLVAATNGLGHMGELTEIIGEVFGPRRDALHEVFGIDTGEARLRRWFGTIEWHAYDNDLVVDDPEAVVAYGLSFPPGEGATAEQAAAFADAVGRRFVDGRFRIRTRTGVFLAGDVRARG
ncbi:MAG: class I SAM-dependent methyltransferase [Actinomycetota bacterium]